MDHLDLTTPFTPKNPAFCERVREDFARQRAMATLGIDLIAVTAGAVAMRFDYRQELTQQHGFIHAGIMTTALDSACGYAALSLMPAVASVVSVEFKTNLLAPGVGDFFIVVAKVIKPGRTITVTQGEAFAHRENEPLPKLVATMTATMMALSDQE